MQVSIKFDPKDVIDKLNQIKNGLGDRAITSAINKVAAQAKTQMSTAIRADYNISASLVRERLVVRKATRRGSATFTAYLVGNPESGGGKRAMNLIHFLERNATKRAFKRGQNLRLDQLRFQIKKAGGPKSITGAFIGNQGRTVFIRVGKGRLPIKAVSTIGVPQMFSTKKNIGNVQAWIMDNFPRVLANEVRYFLGTIR